MSEKIKTLIIDDSIAARALVKQRLTVYEDDFLLDEAEDEASALKILAEKNFDCIILDYMLRDMNGLALAREFKKRKISTPIIILTGMGDEMLAVKSLKAGIEDYLPKKILSDPNFSDILPLTIRNTVKIYHIKREKDRAVQSLTKSEERYRNLVENSPMLMMRLFPDDKIVSYVNGHFCEYFAYEKIEALGDHFVDLLKGDNSEFLLETISSINAENTTVTFENGSVIGGEKKWQLWTAQGIYGKNRNILEYQCMGEDITELKQAEEELNYTLEGVITLKNSQDGDYFLTSLLLEPLGINNANSDVTKIDFLVKEKKEFQFRKWKKEIGGDICLSHNIYLKGKPYSFFVNADAMGKSIQGAGGALVLGSVFRGIIDRTRFSFQEQDLYPEIWIRNSYIELQRIFEGFDGSMMLSLVFGLVDDKTGLLYYINAEHPWTVLYRDGAASFIEEELSLRKLGVPYAENSICVKTFQLAPGDVMLIGSDGRDDILIEPAPGEEKVMNEDERLFLQFVEEGSGELQGIYTAITNRGDLTDDLSLLRIAFHEGESDTVWIRDDDHGELIRGIKKLKKEGNTRQALAELEEAVDQGDADPALLKELLKALITDKEYSRAVEYVELYSELRPEDTEYIYIGSYCFYKTGDFRKAFELAERACLRNNTEVRYLLHLARICIIQKKYFEADNIIYTIFTLDPENKKAVDLKKMFKSKINIVKWGKGLSVGIPEIDKQHRNIIEIVNNLQRALSQPNKRVIIENILLDMTDYSNKHFTTEETLFLEHDYPDYEMHKIKHYNFLSELGRFKKDFTAGKAMLVEDVLIFLNNWWFEHILNEDKKYELFLREKETN
ncbi:MAG: bacteriohemerythrin [bacterium]|nr:bacteriohemerythrin [bacterium]